MPNLTDTPLEPRNWEQRARMADGFPDWLVKLAKIAEPRAPTWFLAYNVVLNEECWFTSFEEGMTPEQCWAEGCSNG